jgi:hypothetical protein
MLKLIPKLVDTLKCSEIIFSDTTGNDLTGYQELFSSENIHSSKLIISLLNCSEENIYNFNQAKAIDLANQNDTFTISDYEDSNVIKSEYIVFFEAPNETLFSIVNGSKNLIITGSEFDDYLNFNYVLLDNQPYKVASIIVDTDITVVLETEYTGPTLIDYQGIFGYAKNFYHAHICTINKCLHGKIATLSTESCSCKDKSIDKVSRYLFMFFGIEVLIEAMNYKKAQEVIDSLKLICQSDKTCGC